jgi:nitroimidazol reductase NimA-like FMN-containing flavoprotein (pyridoxamine 5'-phosphate oxidase superfamily)
VSEPQSDRVRVRRGAHKGRYDRATIHRILDRALFGHVAFVDEGVPCCIPMLVARVGDGVYVHGSRLSRTMRVLAEGEPACLTVTVVDGLVLARSVFQHSANYESVVAFGPFAPVEEPAERLAALEAFTEKLLPGRWAEVREPNAGELKATAVLVLRLDEASAKRRTGPPDDDDTPDAALDVWAGVLPLVTSYGAPVASPGLRPGIELPASVRRLFPQ